MAACALVLLWASPADAGFRIASPTLSPDFSPRAHDYVVDCQSRVQLRVRADRGGRARIGATSRFRGTRSRSLSLEEGQAIRILRKRRRGKARSRYHVRCLPTDFPDYDYERLRRVRAGPFMITPIALDLEANYAIVFDEFGAPIWWLNDGWPLIDAKVLSDGTISTGRLFDLGYGADPRNRYILRNPAGRFRGSIETVGSATDLHDLRETPDGNFVVLSYRPRPAPVDASEFNGDPSAKVLDAVVQKLNGKGKVLWEWNSKDHIDLDETGRWWPRLGGEPYDIVHINAVTPTPDGDYLVSMRHTDAVYRIDGRSGRIEWKLGGEPTPESLKVKGDPVGSYPLGGQHDVQLLEDGTITVHDNGSFLGRPPRGVRYRIKAGRAKLLSSRTDGLAPASGCCGSARLTDGSWLFSWGGADLITEIDERGRRTFSLRMPGTFSYRAAPIDGAIGKRKLRRGMDRQVAR
jgi:hypothetical protein